LSARTMRQGTKREIADGPALSLSSRLVLGTALATSAFVGGYRGYVRRAYAACAPTARRTYLCSGVTTTTQKLPGSLGGVLIVTTDNPFDIDTPVGDALTLTG